VLLTPHLEPGPKYTTPGALSVVVRERLERERKRPAEEAFLKVKRGRHHISYNASTVVVALWFDELIRVVLPLSEWWEKKVVQTRLIDRIGEIRYLANDEKRLEELDAPAVLQPRPAPPVPGGPATAAPGGDVVLEPDVLWMIHVVGTIALANRRVAEATRGRKKKVANDLKWPPPPPKSDKDTRGRQARIDHHKQVVAAVAGLLDGIDLETRPVDKKVLADPLSPRGEVRVHSVSLNRAAMTTLRHSRVAVKADSAARVFSVESGDLYWAVIDSGIDARHPAFRARDAKGLPAGKAFLDDQGNPTNNTRIAATYDFTLIRYLLSTDPGVKPPEALRPKLAELEARRKKEPSLRDTYRLLRRSLQTGREVDWSLLVPFIQVPYDDKDYKAPAHEHGTHVAGIIAADWRADDPEPPPGEGDLKGICPDINLYDLRVLDDKGEGDEFNVIAALQFLRYLKARKDYMAFHGANLSLSIRHDVANYACGRTPVCEECERLVGSGIIVVAAAGNDGYQQFLTAKGKSLDTFRSISITDPGNAEGVITVGSTHRLMPHTYGVSYFSSRGPTGDGRAKPDLVAPGEKIDAPAPNGSILTLDGTSMAAPHVSGAAALLIARHRELAGQPARIKQILCKTATDLGRERYFQGAGMVDILRALQSV
jgi:hypothetical protein